MEAQGLAGQTIHGQVFNSASKFTWKSFLTLRILRKPVKPKHFNFATVGLDQDLINKADENWGPMVPGKATTRALRDKSQRKGIFSW